MEKEERTVRSELVDEINIVGSKIRAAERCSSRDSEAICSAASQGSVKIRCDG